MAITLIEMLDQIDEFLARGDAESARLWSILTALRGPDSEDEDIKLNTTAVIRAAACPKACTKRYDGAPMDAETHLICGAFARKKPLEHARKYIENGMKLHEHFTQHSYTAILGLAIIGRDPHETKPE